MMWGFIPKLEKRWEKPRKNRYPTDPKSLGDHIRKRRMDLNLFQEEVAKIITVTTDCITNWENNRSEPQIQFYPSIIKFLGYQPFNNSFQSIGGKIMLYRTTHGLSHKKLGKLLGVDASTISSWENNKHEPQSRIKQRLLQLLDQK